jgi:hypothetical protein
MDERLIADTIRREVRRSAGIPEGWEFACDWDRVARAVILAIHADTTVMGIT